MRSSTHMLAGAIVGVMVDPSPVVIVAATIGALAPDIDHPQSWMGRRAGPIGAVIRLGARHRGVTHTLITWLLMLYAATLAPEQWQPAAVAFAVGYGTHVWLDALTVTGVPLWWPIPGRVRLARIVTGTAPEMVIEALLLIALLVLSWSVFVGLV